LIVHGLVMNIGCRFMNALISYLQPGPVLFEEVGRMATLQVKGIDDGLYRALGARAKQDHRSISQQVVKLIQDSLGRPGSSAEEATRGFLALCGSWEDSRSARKIAATIRKSRRSDRRFKGGRDVFA